jgi:truncated hemoglobin YjbI
LRRSEITEAGLGEQVERFYGRARLDPVLGPVFDRAITDWPPHIAARPGRFSSPRRPPNWLPAPR